MSKLEFDFEPLNKVLEGKEITKNDAYEVFSHSKYNPEKIFKIASNLRNHHKGKVVSFSKKAFFNIVNLCSSSPLLSSSCICRWSWGWISAPCRTRHN